MSAVAPPEGAYAWFDAWEQEIDRLAAALAAEARRYEPACARLRAEDALARALDVPKPPPPPRTPQQIEAAKLTGRLRRAVFERDRYRCRHCGTWIDLVVDHIIAIVDGGRTESENLQTPCRPCNTRKALT